MYVCICNGVTDKQIVKAIKDGCYTEEEITMETGAGNCCGSCLVMVNDMIEEHANENITSQVIKPLNKNEPHINPLSSLSIAAFNENKIIIPTMHKKLKK